MVELHIDIETYSSIDIKSCGSYKYLQSIDFEILLVAYAFGGKPTQIVDLAQGERLPIEFITALQDPNVKKLAHNATFERIAFRNFGIEIPIEQWECSLVKAAYCGLPLSLGQVGAALGLAEDKIKLASGRALIKYFSCPCKPTKVNGGRSRNFPEHNLGKWEEYKAYCVQDVETEREIHRTLRAYKLPLMEQELYRLDQKINDTGVLIDADFATNVTQIDSLYAQQVSNQIKTLTGVENSNSAAQLKQWLSKAIGKEIKSLAKDTIPALIEETDNATVKEVLRLRQKAAKSSIKKYSAMLNCLCENGRAHGLFQFYGANRTGRWAGRLIQLQNLPQNHLTDLDTARGLVREGDFQTVSLVYDNVSTVLSQLVRTAFIASEGHTLAVADFSAIEARVIAWLAGEQWRLEVFKTHGKIYEASASKMFSVPIEQVTKGSDLRSRAKVAELALGYQGAVGALTQMGGEELGLSALQMESIVERWREANPSIVKLWRTLENCAKSAVKSRIPSYFKEIAFEADKDYLTIKLPSGRKLFYREPSFTTNKWGQESLCYKGLNQTTRQWENVDTYGGKLTENITQAIARDLLGHTMLELDSFGFKIIMHVHDEVVCEVPIKDAEEDLATLCANMGSEVPWAAGLPLAAEGYLTPYYKKD